METKKRCQRCGQEYFLEKDGYNVIKTNDNSDIQLNLCLACQDELLEWMQKYKDSHWKKSYKCWRCGKSFSKEYRFRGIGFLNERLELAGDHFDLCPDCVKSLREWLGEPLLNGTFKDYFQDVENEFIIDFKKE